MSRLQLLLILILGEYGLRKRKAFGSHGKLIKFSLRRILKRINQSIPFRKNIKSGLPIYCIHLNPTEHNLPIYVTESGLTDADDSRRARFIKDHLFWIHKAISEGADVKGYFYWSLLDNFEWDKGFWPRFGLVEVDYKTMERKIRH